VSAADEPSRSIEVERKYDVGPDTALPDWSTLPGVASVGAAEPRELDARYFDTADVALGRARVALRRRTGGPDEGWHVKSSASDGRHEAHWPLASEASADEVPAAVAASVAQWAAPPFTPLARLRNARVAYALRDAAGAQVAEVVDDHVRALAERTGLTREWREWEVELGPAGPSAPEDVDAFFAAVEALVDAAGGRPSASESKLGRALGA
jgi:inorganic triphosphatase YgiF